MSFRHLGAAVPVALLGTLLAAAAWADDWPRWRGPRLDGISRETGLLTEWPKDGPRQLWKATLSGGFSSVAVADGRVFTQTKEEGPGGRRLPRRRHRPGPLALPLRLRLHRAQDVHGGRHAGLADRPARDAGS